MQYDSNILYIDQDKHHTIKGLSAITFGEQYVYILSVLLMHANRNTSLSQ